MLLSLLALATATVESFKVGDLVEATYAGDWKKAVVVGIDPEGKRYQIHFEGDKSCNNHALDMYIAAQWVRARGSKVDPLRPGGNKPEPAKPKTGAAAGKYRVGDNVLVRGGGPLWSDGYTVQSYDAAKRQYRLMHRSGSGDIVTVHSVFRPGDKVDNSFFIGKWEVYVSGSMHTFKEGNETKSQYSAGMKLPPLEIKKDGTYVWRDMKKIIKGKWKPRGNVPGIVILKGVDGLDWTVYENTEGYAPSKKTRDEIRFHHIPSSTGYYMAYRIGANQSAALKGRKF